MYSSVTHIFSQREHDAVELHLENTVRRSFSQSWTPGWPGEIEAAVLDAVFSSRSSYGGPESGVRRVVARWRGHRATALPDGVVVLDELTTLAEFRERPDELAVILGNRQRVAGNSTTKAEAATRVAAVLTELGVRSAQHLEENDDVRTALTAITGVGNKTWQCLLFVAGMRTGDAVDLLRSFVCDAVGRAIDADTAISLLESTAERLGIAPADLEHAVWRYQRRIGVTVPPDTNP